MRCDIFKGRNVSGRAVLWQDVCRLGPRDGGTNLGRLIFVRLNLLPLHHDYSTSFISKHSKMRFSLRRTEQNALDNSKVHCGSPVCTGRHVILLAPQNCEAVSRFSENLWTPGLGDFTTASYPLHSVTPNFVVQMAALQLNIQVVRGSNSPSHRLYRFVPSAAPGKCRNINSSQATTTSYV